MVPPEPLRLRHGSLASEFVKTLAVYLVARTPADVVDMNAALVADVEHAVATGDIGRRGTMLRQVTGLFADNAKALADDQVSLFDVVILKLAQTVARDERMVLSERIADIPNAPCAVIRDLAYDTDVAVAEPVLVRSSRLAEVDIVEISQIRGQDHLHCVSRRRTLSERVTDVLLIRGGDRVVGSVAANRGASFSRAGFESLAVKARSDASLQAILDLRGDGPPGPRSRTDTLTDIRRSPTLSGPQPVIAGSASVPKAASGPDAVGTDDEETQIVAWIGEGRISDALVALARIARVPPETVIAAHQNPDYEAMLFIVRAIRFGWSTLKALIRAKPGASASAEDLRGAFEAFQALSVTTAQRVVRFTVAREAGLPPGD